MGEFIGSGLLSALVIGSSTSEDYGDFIAITGLFVLILAAMPFSGGHLNTAVTVGFYCTGKDFQFLKLVRFLFA